MWTDAMTSRVVLYIGDIRIPRWWTAAILNFDFVLAIEVVRRSRDQNFVIFSHSKSSLEDINNFQIEVDLV